MSQNLLDLHTLAAKAQILQSKYMAGVITAGEFKQQIEEIGCHCHNDICVPGHQEHQASACREIIDGALRVYHMEEK
jgi:hypothetical protein